MKKWIDISVTLKSGMVHWPSDCPVLIRRFKDISKGNTSSVLSLSISSHAGTHMDAPRHFFNKGKSLDRMPLDATIGKARVIHIKDRESIKIRELKKHRIHHGERILFKTANSSRCWKTKKFVKDFVYITKESALYLVKRGIRTVGIDYLSVGGYHKDGSEVHSAFLKKGIWIIEGLNLSKVKQGQYQLICLPLKILDSDGAPARAILYT